jgi:hypothetical protein
MDCLFWSDEEKTGVKRIDPWIKAQETFEVFDQRATSSV